MPCIKMKLDACAEFVGPHDGLRLVSDEASGARVAADITHEAIKEAQLANQKRDMQLQEVLSRLDKIAISLHSAQDNLTTNQRVCIAAAQKPSNHLDILNIYETHSTS